MSAASALPLRDVHLPAAPPWWPLAPGWWLVLGVCTALVVSVWAWRRHRRRQRQRWLDMFDAEAVAATPTAQVAAMAVLLRRAARARQPGAELLQGEAWLQFLDAPGSASFSDGDGRLLLDGGYRRTVAAAEVARLRDLARNRFAHLMTGRPR